MDNAGRVFADMCAMHFVAGIPSWYAFPVNARRIEQVYQMRIVALRLSAEGSCHQGITKISSRFSQISLGRLG